MRAEATLERKPDGALMLEDQDGNPVALWHPDMIAFDALPPSIREYMTGMVNPPSSRGVLTSFQMLGATATLNALREIEMEDRIRSRVQ